jgi:radical SAM enzyme (TIGR01210 family)
VTVDDSIARFIAQASAGARGRSIAKRKVLDPSRPAAKWLSTTRIGQQKGTALSVVLGTIGCSHARGEAGGCTMCSYLLDGSSKSPTPEDLFQQFSSAFAQMNGLDSPLSVKIYTSGSFFDEDEVPSTARERILDLIGDDARVAEVVIESRPEYVSEDVLSSLGKLRNGRAVEIGIGLESSSDHVRSLCINKGFLFADFLDAVRRAKSHSIGVRTYVLLKPPFLTEMDAIVDAKRTIKDALDAGVTTISLNPVNVQKNTLVEQLWKKGRYRSPWLWSVIDVLEYARSIAGDDVNVICDPVAAGKQRGAHNCGRCDEGVVSSIRSFVLTQDIRDLSVPDCECKGLWNHARHHEDVAQLVHQ